MLCCVFLVAFPEGVVGLEECEDSGVEQDLLSCFAGGEGRELSGWFLHERYNSY